jgi:chorismate mutase
MTTRGIRGAISTNKNSAKSILDATQELLSEMLLANPGLSSGDIGSIFFTTTGDLNAVHPAIAARQLGWSLVPLMCAKEIDVPDSLPRVIRVLIHWNTEIPQENIQHVYLGEARALRPDLNSTKDTLRSERIMAP